MPVRFFYCLSLFIRGHQNAHILFPEPGAGYHIPGIVRFSFWKITKNAEVHLKVWVKDDIVSVCPLIIRDEQLKERGFVYSKKLKNPSGKNKRAE